EKRIIEQKYTNTEKQLEDEVGETIKEVKALRKSKAAAKDSQVAKEQLVNKYAALEAKEGALKKRDAELEPLRAALDRRTKELAEREEALSIAQDKLDAETRLVRGTTKEVEQSRAKLQER